MAQKEALKVFKDFKGIVLLSAMTIFMVCVCVFGEPMSNKIVTLRNISAQQAIDALNTLGIGQSVSKVKNVNSIIITDTPIELRKAYSVVSILDTTDKMEIKLFDVDDQFDLEKTVVPMTVKFKEVGFGSFVVPPIQDRRYKALIDLTDEGKVLLIADGEVSSAIEAELIKTIEKGEKADREEQEDEKIIEVDESIDEAMSVEEKVDDVDVSTSELDIMAVLQKAEQQTKEKPEQVEEDKPIENDSEQVQSIQETAQESVASDTGQENQDKMLLEMLKQFGKKGQEEAGEETVTIEYETEDGMEQRSVRLAEPIIPEANAVLELQLPEKVDIVNMLDLLGEYMGLDYIYDEAKIRGDITLKVQGAITVRDLYSYVEAILKSKGFAMVRGRGKLVLIVPVAEAINYDPTILTEDREVKAGNVFVTNVFELNYIDTQTATKLLTDMKLGTSIVQVPETMTIIVTDYAYRMQRIEDLLSIVDKPGEPKEIKFRIVEYIDVTSLIPKLEKLAEELGSVGISTTIQSSAAPQPSRRTVRSRRTPQPKPTPEGGQVSQEKMVFLEADERTNRIIMIGSPDQLGIVNDLIDSLDIKQKDFREIQMYEITNIAAEEVMLKMEELGITGSSYGSGYGASGSSRSRSSARNSRDPRNRQTQAQQNQPTSAIESEEGVLTDLAQVVLLESTNALLVNATPQQHEQIQMIIAYIDQVALESSTPYVVYPLENQNPVDLADTLNEVVSKTVEAKDEQGKVIKVPTTEEEDITIVPDEGTFSVIVYASRKNQEWIGQLIERLDKRRPQVLINVSLVEISDNDSFEYDLDIIANKEDNVAGSIQFNPINSSAGSDVLEGKWDGASLGGFWTADKIQLLLDTIETKDYGRVLAQPKILVNDNEEGVISTSETTYFKQETQSFPGEGTTPVTTVTFDPYDAKIELGITPNIGEGDLLRLTVDMVREDFDPKTDRPPDYARSNVNTIVTVPDGSTIILGGLTKLNQTKGSSKVPLLGDLPLVGGAFRSISNRNDSTKLYIFVKANILRPDDTSGVGQLRRISERNRDEFERAEKKFQQYQSWPGAEPEPIEPIRVLDVD